MKLISAIQAVPSKIFNSIPFKSNDLIEAAKNNNLDKLKEALRSGKYPINAQDKRGRTALIYAARRENPKAVRFLLKAGANPNIADYFENTPLFWGSFNAKITRNLLEHGARPNVSNDRGRTPLMWAASRGNAESAKLLIQHEANVNAVDDDGWSASLWAAEYTAHNVLRILKDNGADFGHVSDSGVDMKFIAQKLYDKELIALLGEDNSLNNPNEQDSKCIFQDKTHQQESHPSETEPVLIASKKKNISINEKINERS